MYLHQKCKNCVKHKEKKCKGYQFNDMLKTVGLSCKSHKEVKNEK